MIIPDAIRKRRFHYKNVVLHDPDVRRYGEWSTANRIFLASFLRWLKANSYSNASLTIYGSATRTAISYLCKDWWQIHPESDIAQVIEHLNERPLTPQTGKDYRKGLAKRS